MRRNLQIIQAISENLKIGYFFANPYHSWERGSNETLNGLIRQCFPKKLDSCSLSDKGIMKVENKVNLRPRKNTNMKLLYLLKINYCLTKKLHLFVEFSF